MVLLGVSAVALLQRCDAQERARQLEVSTDFEGGSAHILEVDSMTSTIHFTPGGDAQNGWVCWWAFKVSNLKVGQRLVLLLSPSDQPTRNNGRVSPGPLDASWSMPRQASVSVDGIVWQHTAPGTRQGARMRYEIVVDAPEVWLAWGPKFTASETDSLLDLATRSLPQATRFELTRSRQDRPVMGLRVQRTEAGMRPPAVWIQARQHAWESGSSWVARGFVEWLVEQGESAKWLVEHAEIVIVPIMDVDNVATGNGGKEADPRDHNRDWDDAPVYPEVRASQQQLLAWSEQNRLDLFVDLHNPAPGDARPFFFCGPPELLSNVGRDNRALFLGIASRQISDPLAVEQKPRITGSSYHPLWRQISGQWVSEHGNSHTLAACLETAWNTPHSTTDGYRTVGQQLGETIVEYLKRRKTAE